MINPTGHLMSLTFPVGVHIPSNLGFFLCDALFPSSSVLMCNIFYSVRHIGFVDSFRPSFFILTYLHYLSIDPTVFFADIQSKNVDNG